MMISSLPLVAILPSESTVMSVIPIEWDCVDWPVSAPALYSKAFLQMKKIAEMMNKIQ